MRLGYACQCVAVPDTQQSTCKAARATEERLKEIIEQNLTALDVIFTYNEKNDIRLFRISSDIIPFGSSPVNQLDWTQIYADKLAALGQKALSNGVRLSMHPGQYTVLNSPKEDVVERAVEDLAYHCAFLDALGLSSEHKMILHIGGVYGDKKQAIDRFCENYLKLPERIKRRLVIENDERNYNIEEVYGISQRVQIPVIFDNLHHQLNSPADNRSEAEWIKICSETWKDGDGGQKMHYSQQAKDKRPGAHSQTIDEKVFKEFVDKLPSDQIDIMLEVKDKNKSAVKCNNYVGIHTGIKYLEEEWARYKYDVLAHSHETYNQIRRLLKDKDVYPVERFYELIGSALAAKPDKGGQINALNHVWGYFKKVASEREKKLYQKRLAEFTEGSVEEAAVRKILYRMACNYQEHYLLNSYYFNE